MLGLLEAPLAIRLIEYLARLAPEMTTETEILDQGVVHLDQGGGSGSLSKRKDDEPVVCLPAIPTWRCPGDVGGFAAGSGTTRVRFTLPRVLHGGRCNTDKADRSFAG